MKKPEELETVNLSELHEAVKEYVEYVLSGEYNCDRAKHYECPVFERAVETFYGKDIWDEWINPVLDEA